MKLFPFQEAFKSGSSVCPHRKFLCFNFPKKEISLRSEPSICLWAELFQETLAAESWKHPGFLLLLGCWDKQLGFYPAGGDPPKVATAHPFLPLLHPPMPSLPSQPAGHREFDLSQRESVPADFLKKQAEPYREKSHEYTHAPHSYRMATSTQSTSSCFPLSLTHELEASGRKTAVF